MLSAEQTRLRLQESEINKLRAENKRLKSRVEDITAAFKDTITALAETLPYSYKIQIINKLKLLESGE